MSADNIGVIGSAKTTNEECYSLVKFARSVLHTPNVDGPCRFYDASVLSGLMGTIGTPAAQVTLNKIPTAGSMLIVGANAFEQLAHVGSRIETARDNGCHIVVADPRTTRLAPFAEMFIHPNAGTDLVWIRALLKTIIDQALYIESAPGLPGFEELRVSLNGLSVDAVSEFCGLDGKSVREVAQLLASNPPAIVMFGLGVLQQAHSTQIVGALADIAILLGGAVFPLRGQNNAQGACDMGLTFDMLPGYGGMSDPAARKVWEGIWNCELPSSPGMSAINMIQACGDGKLKALMVFGENVALSAPNTEETLNALDKVDFLAVTDLYLNETARLADVVFPACSFLEKDGTFTNIERRVQRIRKALDPLGDSRSDLDMIADLASALGKEIERSPDKVMAEIAGGIPFYRGISYEKLDQAWGEPWPMSGDSVRLAPIPDGMPAVGTDADGTFRLIASRINHHQMTGTMSRHSTVLAREYPESFAELNEADAEKLGLRPGSPIRISSGCGSVVRRMLLNESVPRGHVHVPHYFGGDSPNALASYECDPISGVPMYKAYAVKVEAVK
jgi:predicted molibdopterin-dependent oxidoreductase YjgC